MASCIFFLQTSTILTFFLADEKESNITFLFANVQKEKGIPKEKDFFALCSSGLKSSGSNFGKAELTSTLLAHAVATHNRASQRLSYTLFSPAFLHQTSQRQGFLA